MQACRMSGLPTRIAFDPLLTTLPRKVTLCWTNGVQQVTLCRLELQRIVLKPVKDGCEAITVFVKGSRKDQDVIEVDETDVTILITI